jgi:hypothetical protein
MWQQTRVASMFLLSWLLVSCGQSTPYLSSRQASVLVDGSIKVGMSRADVIRRLGRPRGTEVVGEVEFLFYPTSWPFTLIASQHDPVAIVDGKVAGFGRTFYENAVSSPAR